MTPGSRVEVTMSFPSQVTLSDPLRVRFIARVLRVEAQDSAERAGVAAIIEEYEFLQPADGMQGSANLEPSWNFARYWSVVSSVATGALDPDRQDRK
jgi:hypothetical protein